jgi:hypothetical protein
MKSYLQTIALATLLAAGAVFAQSPTPSGAQSKPAPSTSGQAAAPPAQPASPPAAQAETRDPNSKTAVTIQLGEKDAEELHKALQSPELEKKIEEHIDRIGNQINPREWRGAATLALLIPLAGIGLSALTVWFIYRGFKSRMETRMNLHTQLLSKFSSGAEFTEFMSSKGGREFVENLGMSQDNPRATILRSNRYGIIASAAGLGFLIMGIVDGDGWQLGIILLAIGIGFIASSRHSLRMAERLGLMREMNGNGQSNGPAGGGALAPNSRVE